MKIRNIKNVGALIDLPDDAFLRGRSSACSGCIFNHEVDIFCHKPSGNKDCEKIKFLLRVEEK